MINFTVKNVKKVHCDLSASQWELYTSAYPRLEIEGVANLINQAFMRNFNVNAYDREAFRLVMEETLSLYSKYGASDTEPRSVLYSLIEEAYNG